MKTMCFLHMLLCSLFLSILVDRTEQQRNNSEKFSEASFIKPLPDGKTMVYFQFSTTVDVGSSGSLEAHFDENRHRILFPEVIIQALSTYSIHEYEMSLTQGLWDYKRWGYPIESHAPGAELRVWGGKRANEDEDKTWKDFVQVLSGIYCASLNMMDKQKSVSPTQAFPRKGNRYNHAWFRYGVLPRESVCTENLTPWKKLLPCQTAAGIAAFLTSRALFGFHHYSLSSSARVLKSSGANPSRLELLQTLTVVIPTDFDRPKELLLANLLKTPMPKPCPLASKSQIGVFDKKGLTVHNIKNKSYISTNGILSDFNITNIFQGKPAKLSQINPPVLVASRFATSRGREWDNIVTTIENNDNVTREVAITQIIPWVFQVYAHTLKITSVSVKDNSSVEAEVLYSNYQPAVDRERPLLWEMTLSCPPQSSIMLTFSVERSFLSYSEFPPDPHRGFEVPSTVVSIFMKKKDREDWEVLKWLERVQENTESVNVHIYTDIIGITMPTPDFSMPFNVIAITSTVFALAFSTLMRNTLKPLVQQEKQERKSFKERLMNLFKRNTQKKDEDKQD
eukprot:m.28092 g.28092  ORF g.28092 m.28092 type:complete len:566 (+) comp7971_c0_seq2:126-1823(+)